MPDIATALKQAISRWEPAQEALAPATPTDTASKGTPLFKPTTNISRTTFEYIRNNPGLTTIDVVAALEMQGHNKNSVSSLVAQMVRQGMVRREENRLWVTVQEYQPIKAAKTLRRAEERAKKADAYARRTASRLATLERKKHKKKEVVQAPVPAPAPTPVAGGAARLIFESLTVVQAKELYALLKGVFEA